VPLFLHDAQERVIPAKSASRLFELKVENKFTIQGVGPWEK